MRAEKTDQLFAAYLLKATIIHLLGIRKHTLAYLLCHYRADAHLQLAIY